MALLPDRKTPLSENQARDALVSAFTALEGHPPTPNVLALLMAQSALETGHWQSMHHYNWGNLKAYSNWPGDTTTFACGEIVKGKRVLYPSGHGSCIFRAYPSAAAGAKNYVGLILRRPDWRAGLLSGNPVTYNNALKGKTPHYYTASKTKYGAILTRLYHKYGGVDSGSEVNGNFATAAVAVGLMWVVSRRMRL